MGTAAWESDGCDPTCTVPIPRALRSSFALALRAILC